jgi:hypothetical protein
MKSALLILLAVTLSQTASAQPQSLAKHPPKPLPNIVFETGTRPAWGRQRITCAINGLKFTQVVDPAAVMDRVSTEYEKAGDLGKSPDPEKLKELVYLPFPKAQLDRGEKKFPAYMPGIEVNLTYKEWPTSNGEIPYFDIEFYSMGLVSVISRLSAAQPDFKFNSGLIIECHLRALK